MANTIDQSFITQFGTEVKQAYQLQSLLYPVVRKRTGVVGSETKFHTLGASAAYQKSRNADLTAGEPAHDQITCTLADWYATDLVDDLDLLKTNVDVKREYVKSVSFAIAKKIDNIVITAATAGSNVVSTNSGALSSARVREVKKLMDNAAVPAMDRIIVVGASGLDDMLGDTAATSADYNSVKALVEGSLDTWLGFKWITVPDSYLPTNATPTPDTKVCFAFHKEALAAAFGAEPKTFVEWSPDKHAWWIKCVMSMGSVIVDANGVVEFEVDL